MLGEMGKPEAALRFYRRALALDPRLAVAHNNAGKLLVALGRHDEALTAFEAAMRAEARRRRRLERPGRARCASSAGSRKRSARRAERWR